MTLRPSSPGTPPGERDYAPVLARAASAGGGRNERMRTCIDALWDAFNGSGPARGISWVGVYSRAPGAEEMILEYRRNKPACSPIGLYGMCGKSALEGCPVVVRDVRTLGADYIACDPRDLSEVVVPLFDERGPAWGVLDVDSYDVGAFGPVDAEALTRIVEAFGLSARGHAGRAILL